MLNATVSDVHAADGNCILEGVFDGGEFFDCLSHLAALASPVLGSIHHSSTNAVELFDTDQAGLSATVTSHVLTGRDEEASVVDGCIRPVFALADSSSHCKLVLVHGIPGTGKSSLADSALSRCDTAYKASDGTGGTGQVVEEYSYKIQARKRDSVRDGLHKMGLSLCGSLGIGSDSSVDHVLPRLRQFLHMQRFVILADDADEDGLDELLLHLPRSSKPCALIVTSQYGDSLISKINRSDRRDDLVAVELRCFEPKVSLKLVEAICQFSEYAESRAQLQSWLTHVLEQLGQLPLAVRLFAEWLHQELKQPMPEGTAFEFAGLEARWSDEYGKDDDDDAGVLNASMIGSRGLRATVRLALHNLQKLKSREEYDECRQLLGLLALCPPVEVPWSLFDGVSHASAMGQACRVRSADGKGVTSYGDAVVASDKVIEGGESVCVQLSDGTTKIVARSSVTFGPHITGMVDKDDRYHVQLLTPQPYMRGARIELHGFATAVASNGVHGRVVQRHDDGTVSVAFGCETGACLLRVAAARMC
jgi:hypothetical protein